MKTAKTMSSEQQKPDSQQNHGRNFGAGNQAHVAYEQDRPFEKLGQTLRKNFLYMGKK
jgi:hypothetical protein